ncbi:MAG: VanZ family protein [Bacilli bacterium]|nr:VanZ family protein [Bacilli bacterium]
MNNCYTANMSVEKRRIISTSGIVYMSIFVLLTAIILVFSGFSGEISSSQSDFVVNVLNSVLRFFGIILNESQLDTFAFFVRKLIGHFLIFLLDGLFVYLFLIKLTFFKNRWLHFVIAITIMFVVAGASELIQLFASGRSGNLIDVGIDLSGALLGIVIAFIITLQVKEKVDYKSASL